MNKKAVISRHARLRLQTRFPEISPSDYDSIVKNAKTKGKSIPELLYESQELYETARERFIETNTKFVKYYSGMFFVFSNPKKGKPWTLLTVINPSKDNVNDLKELCV